MGGMSEEWKRGVRENVREEGERVVSGEEGMGRGGVSVRENERGEGGIGRGGVSALSGKIRAELGSG